jgi:hypothetical protein
MFIRQAKVRLGADTMRRCQPYLYLCSKERNDMKKCVVPFVVAMIIFTSCRVERPYYETPIGKKKQDYYNKIQYGAKERPKRKF